MLYPTKFLVERTLPAVTPSRGKGLIALTLLTGTCFVLATARGLLTGNWWFFIFLVWNLFLAWFPLGVMLVLRDLRQSGILGRGPRNGLISWAMVGGWLLFMPNAPYIITDLFHLRMTDGNLVWFDTLMIFVGALSGLLAGLYSTLLAHRTIRSLAGPLSAWAFIMACQGLAGFGIYLGRYIRWNSWSIITQPMILTRSLWTSLHDPLAQKVVLTYGFGLATLYVAFYIYVEKEVSSAARY
ncbi:DUF1361 domain-containing protein [Fibrivirga algicola]|uniref:DUF1361 domain-containing protein n=1 Tax=Fibrivirga algicola TaxID=2950420 RepID=A0ABX0QKF6_9BACT|nr:DUF1361 domain-containing protein [Fibrivirga algicola]NID12769.1 DUF1361 domain-containing protein [Fibrivirga algicola]